MPTPQAHPQTLPDLLRLSPAYGAGLVGNQMSATGEGHTQPLPHVGGPWHHNSLKRPGQSQALPAWRVQD